MRQALPSIRQFEPDLADKLERLVSLGARFVQVKSVGKPVTVEVGNLTVEDAHEMVVEGLCVRQCRDLNFWELAHVEDRADIDAIKDWAQG